MGCGTSRGIQIPNDNLTRHPFPPKTTEEVPHKLQESPQQKKEDSKVIPQMDSSASLKKVSSSSVTSMLQNDAAISPDQKAVPKPVCFEIPLEGDGSQISRKVTLRTLEKSKNAPTITAEIIAKKQQVVQERKAKELEKKRTLSQKAMKYRKELLIHRQVQKDHDIYNETELIQSGDEPDNSSYNMSIDFEVDTSYNTGNDDEDMWNDSNHHGPKNAHGHSGVSSDISQQEW